MYSTYTYNIRAVHADPGSNDNKIGSVVDIHLDQYTVYTVCIDYVEVYKYHPRPGRLNMNHMSPDLTISGG